MTFDVSKIREHKTAHILQFAIPSIIAMLLNSLVTIVDGYFTGNYVGSEGLAAINIGLPILYFYLGLGLMLGVGGSTLAGIANGNGDNKKANNVFRQSIFSALVTTVIISALIEFSFLPLLKVLKIQGATADFFLTYYKIMIFAFPLNILTTCFGMFIRTDGKPQFAMLISIINLIVNCVLNYIFAVKFFWGIKGIALASLFTQIVTFILSLIYFCFISKNFKIGKFTFDKKDNKDIILNGSSEFIGELASCISMFCFNFVIMKYVGLAGISAFTVIGYTLFFLNMIVIGFGQGLCPIVSFCVGAKDFTLAKQMRRRTNLIVLGVGIVFTILIILLRGTYAATFVREDEIRKMITSGILFFFPEFILMGFNVICSMYFTACNKAMESAVIASLRGIVILLILTFVFPAIWGLTGVWLVSPVTEVLTLIVTTIFILKDGQ